MRRNDFSSFQNTYQQMENLPTPEGSIILTDQIPSIDHPDLESIPIQDLLSRTKNALNNIITISKSFLETLRESETQREHTIKFEEAVETLNRHIEFSDRVLKSKSAEEIETAKQELQFKEAYQSINTKEDFNPVMIHYTLEFLIDNLFKKIEAVLSDCSKLKKEELLAQGFNLSAAWLQIVTYRLQVINQSYAFAASYSKLDIFSYPRTSQRWQDLYKLMTYKKIVTKEDIQNQLHKSYLMIRAFYALIKSRTEGGANLDFSNKFSLLKELVQYFRDPAKTEALALLFHINPTQDIFKIFKMTENVWVTRITGLALPYIGCDRCIYVPKLFPKITLDLILKEREEQTLNKLDSSFHVQVNAPNLSERKVEVIRDLLVESNDKVKIRILGPEPLNLQNDHSEKLSGFIHKTRKLVSKKQRELQTNTEAIVIYFHGGGFVSGSSAMHRTFMNRWVCELGIVHFSVDYSLAPENKYPDALDDIWQAYLWILHYADTILGIKYKKIILGGDSAGGNLVLALTFRLIRAGLRVPDGCLLLYPSVFRLRYLSTPSTFNGFEDPLLSFSVHTLFGQEYAPDGYESLDDPFFRPLVARDQLLEKLPPVRITTGTADLIYDNNWRLLDKLNKLKKNAKITVYENLPHGFYNMSRILKCYDEISKDACDLIQELINS